MRYTPRTSRRQGNGGGDPHGHVIDKSHEEAYDYEDTEYSYQYGYHYDVSDGEFKLGYYWGPESVTRHVPEKYTLTISSDETFIENTSSVENGKETITIECSSGTYDEYAIGDEYPKTSEEETNDD